MGLEELQLVGPGVSSHSLAPVYPTPPQLHNLRSEEERTGGRETRLGPALWGESGEFLWVRTWKRLFFLCVGGGSKGTQNNGGGGKPPPPSHPVQCSSETPAGRGGFRGAQRALSMDLYPPLRTEVGPLGIGVGPAPATQPPHIGSWQCPNRTTNPRAPLFPHLLHGFIPWAERGGRRPRPCISEEGSPQPEPPTDLMRDPWLLPPLQVPRVARCPHPLPGPPPALAASGPASPCWPWLRGVCEVV